MARLLPQIGLAAALGLAVSAVTVAAVAPGPAAPDWAVQAREIRRQQLLAVHEYATVPNQEGRYQVPVELMMDRVAADPTLLASTPIYVDPNATPEDLGRLVFTKLQPCSTCHAIEPADMAVKAGPRLHGRFGGVTKLQGGEATFDEAYVTQSIRDPHAQLAEGFQDVMPVLPLTDDQVAQVIAYLKTLK